MKRSGPPARRTPLKRSAGPKTPPPASKPATGRSRAATGPSEETRAAVIARAGGICEVCGEKPTRDYSIHHRRPRGMGGTRNPATNSPANLMYVCGSGTTGCHGRIESERKWAGALGYLLRSGAEPIEEPIVLHGRRRVYLDPSGVYNPG